MNSPFKDKHGRKLEWGTASRKIITRVYHYWLDTKLFFLHTFVGKLPFHFLRNNFYRLSGISIGPKSTIHTNARFYQPKNIKIGEGTIIGDHATLDGRATLTIGNHVDIASEVMIFNSQHDIHDQDFSPIEKPVNIKDYVFIGPRTIILPGVTISKGAVVAAGAVVTQNVAPKSIVGGIPAEKIGERKIENFSYRLGRPRLFQ